MVPKIGTCWVGEYLKKRKKSLVTEAEQLGNQITQLYGKYFSTYITQSIDQIIVQKILMKFFQ